MTKILVANRGEIACRIIKSIHKMGFQSVAVYSDADKNAKHVQLANEAYHIGPPAAKDSYLRQDKLFEVCEKSGATMIHPGYGFLSENADFANNIKKNNLIFIGPGIEAITTMGSKLAAKEAVSKYDIPMVPGTEDAVTSLEEARKIAQEIGFPILIKASAGGGGKGMRLVEKLEDIESQMKMAISEAESSFGDGAVFIEKYITNPRHIEIQILADNHGNIVHLFERECSIQRRHQKVVEEAPSAVLNDELRKKMGEAAVRVAQSCSYTGAGTVEFLLDDSGNFYFLEMNTRLQVEHPVSELISGVDLVEQQILVALGNKLTFTQDDLSIKGHAMELRIYAEDPLNDFLPDIGTITKYIPPTQDFVRLDDAFFEGDTIPIYYDPMIAKLVTYGTDRKDAINKMREAISTFQIEGIKTTLGFGAFVMNHEAFVSGKFTTKFVAEHFDQEKMAIQEKEWFEPASALLAALKKEQTLQPKLAE